MLVSDLMNTEVVSVSPDESVGSVARLLSRCNLGCVPVVSGGKLMGVCTDRDLVLRCLAPGHDPAACKAADVMSREPVTVAPNDDTLAASRLMARHQVRRLPVVDKGRIVGMISLGDLARCTACDMEASDALSEISSNIRRR